MPKAVQCEMYTMQMMELKRWAVNPNGGGNCRSGLIETHNVLQSQLFEYNEYLDIFIIRSISLRLGCGDDAYRIQSGWKNWKRVSGILCDRRINVRVKGKVYKTVVRPAMMYGADTWAVKKAQEKKLDVSEMRMLRWMSGVTKLDRIGNERIRGTTKVGEISKKVQESRLKWYEKRRRIRRQESDGDGGAGEKKERKTKAEVDGYHRERLV